jgi:hypothetical protein
MSQYIYYVYFEYSYFELDEPLVLYDYDNSVGGGSYLAICHVDVHSHQLRMRLDTVHLDKNESFTL